MPSRCHQWNSAFEGISNYISQSGIKVNRGSFAIETKILNKYCSIKNITGSFSQRVLLVSNDFKSFKEYIKSLNR